MIPEPPRTGKGEVFGVCHRDSETQRKDYEKRGDSRIEGLNGF